MALTWTDTHRACENQQLEDGGSELAKISRVGGSRKIALDLSATPWRKVLGLAFRALLDRISI